MTSLVETLKWEKSLSTIFKLYNIKEYVYNFQSYTGSETKMYLKEFCIIRVAQNFKHEKFIWDQTDSGSLGSKHCKNAKILKFGQYLDIAKCDQNFTT